MREINLLPPSRRNTLRREALLGAVTHFLRSVLASVLLLTAAGVSVLALLWALIVMQPAATDAKLAEQVAAYQALRDTVSYDNFFLEAVQSYAADRLVWSDTLVAFFEVVPPGVTLTSLSGTADVLGAAGTAPTLFIDGRAEARGTLTFMQERLRALPGVTGVEAPTSNFLQRDNPAFQFNIQLSGHDTP